MRVGMGFLFRIRDSDQAQQVNSLLPGFIAPHVLVDLQHFSDLVSNLEYRVQA